MKYGTKLVILLYSVHTPRLCDNLNEVVVFEQIYILLLWIIAIISHLNFPTFLACFNYPAKKVFSSVEFLIVSKALCLS